MNGRSSVSLPPKRQPRVPKLRHHKATGQGFVELSARGRLWGWALKRSA
jgi:hypothetical protein